MATSDGTGALPKPMFGRASDLDALRGRAARKGVTALVGRPMAGKSRLLEELRDQEFDGGTALTGYAEATGATSDLLLLALADLYTRWLSDSSYWEQAKKLYDQYQKKGVVGQVGSAIGKFLSHALKLEDPSGVSSKMAHDAFSALGRLDSDLKTGGITQHRLTYDQVKDLTVWLAQHTGRRVILILDALEQAPNLRQQVGHAGVSAERGHLARGLHPSVGRKLGTVPSRPPEADSLGTVPNFLVQSPISSVPGLGRRR